MLRRYCRLWYLLSLKSLFLSFLSRFGATIFIIAKISRLVFFLLFLIFALREGKILANYTLSQVILFFLTFNLVDMMAQLFFREVYRFRPLIISGNFDFILLKPMNSLFPVLLGGADFLDLITLLPLLIAIVFLAGSFKLTVIGVVAYLLLVINGLLIAASFHIMVLALAVLTTEIDHTMMIYRDLTQLGQIPIDVYQEPIRSFLTFVIPVAIMMTFPAKALMSLLSFPMILLSLVMSAILFPTALKIWRYSLRYYTSASS